MFKKEATNGEATALDQNKIEIINELYQMALR